MKSLSFLFGILVNEAKDDSIYEMLFINK